MHTPEARQAYIATIANFPGKLRALVDGLTPEQLTTAYLPDEWTVAQNIHHVADSHMNSYIRVKLILTEDKPPLKGYDQDVWATFPDAADADINNSLIILEGLHRRWVKVWQGIREEQWGWTGDHSEIGAVSVDALVQMYAEHCEAHIDQITCTLQAGNIR